MKCTLRFASPVLFLFLSGSPLLAQERHYDFLGAGHQNEVRVSTSSGEGERTISGFPIQNEAQLNDASRFLAQTSFGADFATIQMTAAMGYSAWLDEQFALPQLSALDQMMDIAKLYDVDALERPVHSSFFRPAWLTLNKNSPGLLRERMAFALSQIFVINDRSDEIEDFGQIVAQYHDLMTQNAFGNYKNLLTNVTYNPLMGRFLTFYQNPKADPANNVQPDENYAREIMQLFSIGLWELNLDGSRKRDANGQFIPTYNNQDIDEFAKVFTGFTDAEIETDIDFDEAEEEEIVSHELKVQMEPMIIEADMHEPGEKRLLNGFVIPANQAPEEDIDQTMTHLSTHANTAPFMAKALIQFFTTSNPSYTYVQDVATTFRPLEQNNFQEVLRTILLHPEARAAPTATYSFGKLKEPMIKLMNLLRAFPLSSANEFGHYAGDLQAFSDASGQSPYFAPSVFNFFQPDYQPQGPIAQRYLVAPEFQILNSTNAIGTINDLEWRIFDEETALGGFEEGMFEEDEQEEEEPERSEWNGLNQFDFSTELALATDPVRLVKRLNTLLAQGQLSTATQQIILDALLQLDEAEDRVRMAIFLVMISPDYAVLK